MKLETQAYSIQAAGWPSTGRQILAQWNKTSIVVYQAYKPAIADYAVAHGRLGGGDFSFDRMSWIKPNFLWMMFRSGWGTKPNQERILAMWLRRSVFDALLEGSVSSSFDPTVFSTHEEWKRAVRSSEVRSQWDPDHHPSGAPVTRRAIQLGLRGTALREVLGGDELVNLEDITPFVSEQREPLQRCAWQELRVPIEMPYPVSDDAVAQRLRIDVPGNAM